MTRKKAPPVYGHDLPPPRVTVWVPFLVATLLSLPVLIGTGLKVLF